MTDLIEPKIGDIQKAWNSVDSLPAIIFTEHEEAELIEALANIAALRAGGL